jgi:MoaA/NifB/PqqE/SkfB family radical SAM enzyme
LVNLSKRNYPKKVSLDASTVCQLNCKTCPNGTDKFKNGVGIGFLKFADFKAFIDKYPKIKSIGLSNWGEMLLNPELISIMEYAFEKGIKLTANGGVNFNNVDDKVLNTLVRTKFNAITFAIDGCSQDTYQQYRINGNYDRVINNIRKLVRLKLKYNSHYPILRWQYISFGFNQHEIKKAKSFASELGLKFNLKLSWDDLYGFDSFSPVLDSEITKIESGLGVSNREEYYKKYLKNYTAQYCLYLWNHPHINFDGKLLGCSINYWGHYGNVFDSDLFSLLNGEQMAYARQMLRGKVTERSDIPCTNCPVYKRRKKRKEWVSLMEIFFSKRKFEKVIFRKFISIKFYLSRKLVKLFSKDNSK